MHDFLDMVGDFNEVNYLWYSLQSHDGWNNNMEH